MAKRAALGSRSESIKAAIQAGGLEQGGRGKDSKAGRIKAEGGIVALTLRLPRDLHEALRSISYHQRVPIHTLCVEGVEHVVKKRGQAK